MFQKRAFVESTESFLGSEKHRSIDTQLRVKVHSGVALFSTFSCIDLTMKPQQARKEYCRQITRLINSYSHLYRPSHLSHVHIQFGLTLLDVRVAL
jgi:hypothetical protein